MKKIITILITVLVITSLTACKSDTEDVKDDTVYNELSYSTSENNEYKKIIVSSLEDTARQANVIEDTVSVFYDMPGNGTIQTTTSYKTGVLDENNEIFNYDYLDENGIYYLNNASTSVNLFKFRVADSQVATYLEDDTAVKKSMTIRNSVYPSSEDNTINTPVNMTGLYAPAGELIKIEISEELAKTNPKIYIGATSITGETNDISSSDAYSRMPLRVKELTLSNKVNYVGSPLGGQIYIQANLDIYDVSITGAVEYMHYIHNTSTREDLERLYDSTSPMIDIEVPGYVRINMPRAEITNRENEIYNDMTSNLENFDEDTYKENAKQQVIDEIIETANYWKLVSEISTYICPEDLYRTNTVTMFFDSYVLSSNSSAGKNFSTFEINSGRNLLNQSEDKITELTAFNKHFWNNTIFVEQGSSDTIANVLTILSYMLYDTYGAYRTYSTNNHTYSDAGSTLDILNKSTSGTNYATAKYATLIHSFGVHTFIEAITTDVDEDAIKDRLYLQFCLTTKLNMQYYFEEVLGWEISDGLKEEIKLKNYEMYIPIASNLQIGQVINGENIYLTQAYEMHSFEEININESLVVPKGMDVKIESISKTKGTLVEKNNAYFYSTNLEEIDEFNVEATVYNDDYSYTVTLIFAAAVQYSSEIYSKSTTTLYNNVDNLSLDDINYNDLSINTTFTLSNSVIQYSVDTGSNGVFVTYAEIIFPSSQDYTLVVRGLGDMRISIGESYNDLEEVIRYKHEGSASSYDKDDEDATYTLSTFAYQKVYLKIEVSSVAYNTYERVEFYLGYVNGSSVSNIPDDWWYGQYSASPTVNAPTSTVYSTSISNLDELNEDNLSYVKTFAFNSPAFGNGQTNGYYLTYAYIVLPETKEYTLIVSGRGDMRISIGESHDDLTEVARFTSLNTVSSYDITDETSTFKLNAIEGEKILIKVEIFDPARGEFNLGYIENENVVSLTDDQWYGSYNVNKEAIVYSYSPYNTESFYSTSSTISSYSSINEDLNIIYQTGKLDDKFLTTPNSDKQSIDPGSIVIYKYNQEVSANYFSLISSTDGEGILSFFEIYVSGNGVDWTEAFNGVCDYESTCSLALNSTYTFKYVKLVFISQYTGNYIDICNFEFQLRCNDLTVIDCPDNFLYSGHIDIVESATNLNQNIVEFDGKIKFSFTGSSILLFANTSSKYGVIQIKINDVVYEIDLSDSNNTAQQILAISALEYGTYSVEITVISGTGNIDYIAVE